MARNTPLFAHLLAPFALLSACETAPEGVTTGDDPAIQYIERGLRAVGHATLEEPREGLPALEIKAWYPAQAASDATIDYPVTLKLAGLDGLDVTFLGDAAQDASPDAEHGPYPLVVLSHGFALNPEWYHPLAEHLASHGFVVLAPEHAESDWQTDIVAASVARPAELSATIDLAASGILDGIVDSERVALVGHSYGGYAVLAAAGARFDTEGLAERCADVSDAFTAAYFCEPFLASESGLAEAMGLESIPEGLWPSLADPRVDAIVPMAGDAYLFGERGLAEITVPTMVLGGTADTGTPWAWGAGLTFANVSSDERLQVALEGAEHFIETTTCDRMPWTAQMPEEYRSYFCEDPAWDKPEALALTNQITTAFLLHTLRDDPAASTALAPATYDAVDGFTLAVHGADER